jgi:D-glycero-beta-D-manno-heptose-7-phosphate kinase
MITGKEIQFVQEKAKGLKALVIGDSMLDRYIYGTVERISPEAPVPILSHQHSEIKAGGAANVALNLAAWGCHTTLIGLAGVDSNAKVLTDLLEKQHIRHHLYQSLNRPTTVKTRVVASSHHLLRIDEESTDYLAGEEEMKVLDHIQAFLTREKPELIILEDYNKGLLTADIIKSVIGYGQENGVFIAVDPKEKNFFDYSGVNLFKPNLREAGHAARRHLNIGDLSELCSEWLKRMNINTIAITLGGQGIFLQSESDGIHVRPERQIDVIDVCGAGDAVICSLALGAMSGLNLETCGSLANLTGAYVCSHSGVVSVDVEEIYQWI